MNIPLQKRDILILNSLHKLGPLSNQELAQLFDLSPSSISNILKQLITKGILTEIDSKFYKKKNRERERSKKTYHLNPNYGYAIAVEIDYDFLNIFIIASISALPDPGESGFMRTQETLFCSRSTGNWTA